MYQYFKRKLKTPTCFGSFGIHPRGVVGVWQREIWTCGVCVWCDELRTIKVIDFKKKCTEEEEGEEREEGGGGGENMKLVQLSLIRSLFTVHSAMVYVTQLSSRTRMELSSILVLLESCLQTCIAYTTAECSVNKLLMMDRRTVRNM